MATYTELTLRSPKPEQIGKKIRSLFADAPVLVELVRSGNDYIFRAWHEAPYKLEDHTKLGTGGGP